jgi:AraC-like DNA-binding protein
MIRALVDAAEHSGVPAHALLHAAQLDVKRLTDPFGRFEFAEWEALQILALDMAGDPAFGLHIVERCSDAAFDLLARLAPHAPTLRDAVALCSQFGDLLVSGSHVSLEEDARYARVRYAFRRLSPRADRMHAEHAVTGFFRLIRVFAGKNVPLRRACFEHPAPSYREEYRRTFGTSERFDQPFTGLEFDRRVLDVRHLHQQPRIYALLREEAQRMLDSLATSEGYADRARHYLMAQSPSRIPKMNVAASALGISARSLRRHLAAEGVSYRALVQERLKEAAVRVLRASGGSVQEAARVTGFSDSASFHRAFKQWTGVNPTAYRLTSHSESSPRT